MINTPIPEEPAICRACGPPGEEPAQAAQHDDHEELSQFLTASESYSARHVEEGPQEWL